MDGNGHTQQESRDSEKLRQLIAELKALANEWQTKANEFGSDNCRWWLLHGDVMRLIAKYKGS